MRQSREQHVMRAAPRAFVGVAPSLGRPISGLSQLRLNDVLGKKKRALEFLLLLSRLQPPYMGKPYLRLLHLARAHNGRVSDSLRKSVPNHALGAPGGALLETLGEPTGARGQAQCLLIAIRSILHRSLPSTGAPAWPDTRQDCPSHPSRPPRSQLP